MNIFLLPYTWMRHLAMAFWCGGAGMMAWWLVLTVVVQFGVYWPPSWDGPVLMCAVSAAVASASILGECALRAPLEIGGLDAHLINNEIHKARIAELVRASNKNNKVGKCVKGNGKNTTII